MRRGGFCEQSDYRRFSGAVSPAACCSLGTRPLEALVSGGMHCHRCSPLHRLFMSACPGTGTRSCPAPRIGLRRQGGGTASPYPVSYTHLRAHETDSYLVCRLLLEKKK